MTIDEYNDSVQNYLRGNYDIDFESNLYKLNLNNIQSIINQDFNSKTDIVDCAKKIKDILESDGNSEEDVPNEIFGDRALNTLEKVITNFKSFCKKYE